MPDLTDIIPTTRLDMLQERFASDVMDAALAAALPSAAPISLAYIQAIANALGTQLPSDTAAGVRMRMSQEDRERVLIGLLASRSERLNLAVHLYYAIGLGIALDEILHILLLAGIYSGLPNFANSIEVAGDAFKILASLPSSSLDPVSVLKSFKTEFDLPPLQP